MVTQDEESIDLLHLIFEAIVCRLAIRITFLELQRGTNCWVRPLSWINVD